MHGEDGFARGTPGGPVGSYGNYGSYGTPMRKQEERFTMNSGFGGYGTPARKSPMMENSQHSFNQQQQYGHPQQYQQYRRPSPSHQDSNQVPSFFDQAMSPARATTPDVKGWGGESMFSFAAKGGGMELDQHQFEQNKYHSSGYRSHAVSTPIEERRRSSVFSSANVNSSALVNVDDDDDIDSDVLPPSTSLLSGLPARSAMISEPMEAVEETGMRRRQAIRTSEGSSNVGLDLGAPRGLDLSTPIAVDPRGPQRDVNDLGVTAAIHLVQVKSPWVTVFGFPSGAASSILRHFQTFGEVHQHRSESGNWMHILYGSKIAASRALAQNGQFIIVGDSTVMVGVKPCSDPSLADVAATTAIPSTKMDQKASDYSVKQSDHLKKAPKRAASVCKRFWTWVLDM